MNLSDCVVSVNIISATGEKNVRKMHHIPCLFFLSFCPLFVVFMIPKKINHVFYIVKNKTKKFSDCKRCEV